MSAAVLPPSANSPSASASATAAAVANVAATIARTSPLGAIGDAARSPAPPSAATLRPSSAWWRTGAIAGQARPKPTRVARHHGNDLAWRASLPRRHDLPRTAPTADLPATTCAWCGADLPDDAPRGGGRVRCVRCGAATTDPWPSEATLNDAYRGWYRPAGGRFAGPGDALLRRSRGALARRLDRIAPPGRVLDVGAGDGTLLDALRRAAARRSGSSWSPRAPTSAPPTSPRSTRAASPRSSSGTRSSTCRARREALARRRSCSARRACS